MAKMTISTTISREIHHFVKTSGWRWCDLILEGIKSKKNMPQFTQEHEELMKNYEKLAIEVFDLRRRIRDARLDIYPEDEEKASSQKSRV